MFISLQLFGHKGGNVTVKLCAVKKNYPRNELVMKQELMRKKLKKLWSFVLNSDCRERFREIYLFLHSSSKY